MGVCHSNTNQTKQSIKQKIKIPVEKEKPILIAKAIPKVKKVK